MAKMSGKIREIVRNTAIIIGGLAAAAGGMIVMGALMLFCISIPFFAGLAILAEAEDELLFTSVSPTGEYVLEAVRENTPAIEPYYVKINRVDGEEKHMVYYVRGQEEAEIIWLSDMEAQINGVPVDITSGDCFKANARGYFDVNVQVKAADVRWLEVTVCMDGEPRLARSRTGVELVERVDAWGLSNRLNVLKELHWDDDLTKKKAGLMITVETAGGERISLPYLWEWTAKVYGVYTFTLTGSRTYGYHLMPEGITCKISEK